MSSNQRATTESPGPSRLIRWLDALERLGNRLPDPVVLFIMGIVAVWIFSAILSWREVSFSIPGNDVSQPIVNLFALQSMAKFLSSMVEQFSSFPPLSVVLVTLMGVGIAERSGMISSVLRLLLQITPRRILTPMIILVALVSHTAADAGFVLVIPIGGVMFYAVGRHPLAGIAAAFAGVSGGFSANFLFSGIDPLLASITEAGAKIIEPVTINPLCNFYFTASSSFIIIAVGWAITELVVEPKVSGTAIDGDPSDMPAITDLAKSDYVALVASLTTLAVIVAAFALWAIPEDSALRDPQQHSLTSNTSPLMKSIVAIIFLLFAIPGIVHGFVAGTFKTHRDVVQAMSKTMETMSYYLVLVFFAALFIAAFRESQIGPWLAVTFAALLGESGLPIWIILIGIILFSSLVDLLIGSSSAKWAMLAPFMVPMMMLLGVSPEMTQAAYRIGDSTTNIITPMMPYFPLVVVFCQKYVKATGVGTLVSMMLPYSVAFMICWTAYFMIYWQLGIPLGIGATYEYSR